MNKRQSVRTLFQGALLKRGTEAQSSIWRGMCGQGGGFYRMEDDNKSAWNWREGTGGRTAGRGSSVACTKIKDASSLTGEEAGFGQLGQGSSEGFRKFSWTRFFFREVGMLGVGRRCEAVIPESGRVTGRGWCLGGLNSPLKANGNELMRLASPVVWFSPTVFSWPR